MRVLFAVFSICFIAFAAAPVYAQNDSGGGGSGMDIDATMQGVMMDSSRDASNDLKDQAGELDKNNKKKQAQRDAHNKMKQDKDKLKKRLHDEYGKTGKPRKPGVATQPKPGSEKDSLGDMSNQDTMDTQQLQDPKSKAGHTLSNILRKTEDTNSSAANNLK